MNIFDLILLFIFVVAVLRGIQVGFLSSLLGAFGWMFGLYFASQHYNLIASYLGGTDSVLYPWLSQFLLFILSMVGVGVCKLFLRQILVNISWVSRLLGGVVNFIKTMLLTVFLLSAMSAFSINEQTWWKESVITEILLSLSDQSILDVSKHHLFLSDSVSLNQQKP